MDAGFQPADDARGRMTSLDVIPGTVSAMPVAAPYGGWRSPITAASIAAGEVSLGNADIVGDDVYWLEGKPLEAGRVVVVRHAADGTRQELTPKPLYVRTRVHEYGGGAYLVDGSTVFFSNFADQRLYRQDAGGDPRPITPEPTTPAGLRYADAQLTPDGRLLVCVREVHESDGPEATNELVVLAADGSAEARVIACGHDFYSSPRISPDGRRLAWMVWDHPRMPWDGSEVWVGDLDADGSISNPQTVAGRRRGIDLPARMESVRRAPLRVRPDRLVESVPPARRDDRAAGADGGRIRHAAVGLRHEHLRLPGRWTDCQHREPGWPRSARDDPARASRPDRRPAVHRVRAPVAFERQHAGLHRRLADRVPMRSCGSTLPAANARCSAAASSTSPMPGTFRARARSLSRPTTAPPPRTRSTTHPPTPTSLARRASGRR